MASSASHNVNRQNAACARALWPDQCSASVLQALRELSTRFHFSVRLGEVRLLNGAWYVTNGGLMRLASRRRCRGICSRLVPNFSDPTAGRWVFRATVYKSAGSRGFVGYGDADPSNVSPLVRGAEMRVAETRAVNRALRKAYGIGLCSVEELGHLSSRSDVSPTARIRQPHSIGNHNGNGHPRLRDRLCLLIREHQLDPALVKRYAADFCGTEELREASRELVESFITHLAQCAVRDRDALVCKLNSYAPTAEVRS